MKKLFTIFLTASMLNANEYDFDLLDDIFNFDLEQLKTIQIDTASKSLQSLDTTPAKIVVITKEQIEQRGYKSLDELLNDLSGFSILRHADSGILNQIGVRGITGNHYFKLLLDGIEINQTDGEITSVSSSYSLFGIKRVEILYGAASVIYGADTVSAVINLISDDSIGAQAVVYLADNGYKYFFANQRFKIDDALFSYKAHLHTDQDYRFSKYYKNDFYGNDSYDFKPHESKSLSLKYEKDALTLGANYIKSVESTLISMNGENSQKKNYIFDKNANLNMELFSSYITYKKELFPNLFSNTTLAYESTKLQDKSYFINKFTNYEKAYKYSNSKRVSIEQTFNKRIDNHDITFGLMHERFTSQPMSYDLGYSKDRNPTLNKTDSSLPDIYVPLYKEKWQNSSVFLQDQIDLNDNFILSLAARYTNSNSYSSSLIPRVALIYKNDFLSHKLIYSEAFLAPSNYNKSKMYGSPLKKEKGKLVIDEFRVANKDLKPEKSKTYEYNLDILLNQNHSLAFSTYYTNVKDLILIEESLPEYKNFFENIEIKNPKGAKNAADSKIYGFDISYLGQSYFSGYDFEYWLNYSFTDGKINHDDLRYKLFYISNHTLKAGTTFKYKNFTLTPSFRWLSPINASPYRDKSNKVAEKRVNGYFLANLYSSYKIDKQQTVSLKIDNLFDNRYYLVRYNSSSKYKTPQEARRVSLGYTYNF